MVHQAEAAARGWEARNGDEGATAGAGAGGGAATVAAAAGAGATEAAGAAEDIVTLN